MQACPSCGQVAFQGTACAACGYELAVLTGQPAALPMDALTSLVPAALPMDALEPLEEFDLELPEVEPAIEMVTGFEATALEASPVRPRAKAAPPPSTTAFQHAECPSCRTPQPSPNPVFCDGCGYRLRARVKKDANAGATKHCG